MQINSIDRGQLQPFKRLIYLLICGIGIKPSADTRVDLCSYLILFFKCRENIPEQFQGNLHYEQSEEASSNMEEAVESLDQVLDCLEEATQQ